MVLRFGADEIHYFIEWTLVPNGCIWWERQETTTSTWSQETAPCCKSTTDASRARRGTCDMCCPFAHQKTCGKKTILFSRTTFFSLELFKNLLDEKTFCLGTLREDRKHFPPSLKGQVLKNQGDNKFTRDGNLVCTICKDKARKKHVTVFSFQCNPTGDPQADVLKPRVK